MPSVYTGYSAHGVRILSRTVLWNGPPPFDFYGVTALTEIGPVWMANYVTVTDHDHADAATRCHLRFSIDQGLTWSAEDKYYDGSALTNVPFPPNAGHYYHDVYPAKAPNGDLLMHIPTGNITTLAYLGTTQWRSTNGGRAWTNEGLIFGGGSEVFDHDGGTIVDGVLYASARITPVTDPGAAVPLNNFYKSLDNGVTWSFVSHISQLAVDEATGEGAMEWLGGERLVVLLRGSDYFWDDSFLRYSNDLGLTWGPLTNFSDMRNGAAFERMRLRRIGSRIYAVGRIRPLRAPGGLGNCVFWSDDEGQTWTQPAILNSVPYQDCGYGDLIRRGDRTFFYLCYEGTFTAASVVAYVFDVPSHTPDKDAWWGGDAVYVPPIEPEPALYALDFREAENSMYMGVI